MDGKNLYFFLLLSCLFLGKAEAAVIELSATGAYGKVDFSDYKSTQRRYSGSIEFKFTPVSSIQFEYMNTVTKTSFLTDVGLIDSNITPKAQTYTDKVYSFNWVQNLVPAKWLIQPYIVFGGGRMVRKYREDYPVLRRSYEASQSDTTGVGGAGLRIFFLKNFAIKGEVKTYVPSFRFSQWKANQMLSVGFSWVF